MESAEILSLLVRGTLAASLAIAVVLAIRVAARRAFGALVSYALWLLVPAAVLASYVPRHVVLAAPPFTPNGSGPHISAGPSSASGTVILDEASFSEVAAAGVDLNSAILVIWLCGALFSLLLLVIDHWRALRRLRS